jgi:hypothetical protein
VTAMSKLKDLCVLISKLLINGSKWQGLCLPVFFNHRTAIAGTCLAGFHCRLGKTTVTVYRIYYLELEGIKIPS